MGYAPMDPIASLTFQDLIEECEAYAYVQAGRGMVAVALSLTSNRDTALFVTPQIARELAAALEAGAKHAESVGSDA